LAEAIRGQGYVVRTLAEVYGEDARVEDVTWIRDADGAGWVALTKDERITRRPYEQQALTESHLRVFAIGNQHLTGAVMAGYYRANLNRIVQRARRPGPFVDIVHPDSVERRWPRPAAAGRHTGRQSPQA
jgi:hypothetical protein